MTERDAMLRPVAVEIAAFDSKVVQAHMLGWPGRASIARTILEEAGVRIGGEEYCGADPQGFIETAEDAVLTNFRAYPDFGPKVS